ELPGRQWGPQDLIDPGGPGRQHHQTVKAERHPACLGHDRERCEEILIDRITFAIELRLERHVLFEAVALLVGIGKLAETVGQLHAAGIKLEALGYAGIMRTYASERCFDHRIFIEEGRPSLA